MPHAATTAFLLTLGERIWFDGDLRWWCGGTEKPFSRSPLLPTQLCFQGNDLFLKRVYLLLLLKTTLTKAHASPFRDRCTSRKRRYSLIISHPVCTIRSSMRRPFRMACRSLGTSPRGTCMHFLRLPSMKEKMNEGCLSPRLHTGQEGRIHGFRTSARDPLAIGHSSATSTIKPSFLMNLLCNDVFMLYVYYSTYMYTSKKRE